MAVVWYSVAILLAFSIALPTHVLCYQTSVPWQRNFLSDQDRIADLETSETVTNYAIVNQRREDNSPQIKLPPFLFQQAPNGLSIPVSSLALEADISNSISFKPPSPPTFRVSENRLTSSEGSGGITQLYSMWCGCTIECPCPEPECECSIAGCINCSDDEIDAADASTFSPQFHTHAKPNDTNNANDTDVQYPDTTLVLGVIALAILIVLFLFLIMVVLSAVLYSRKARRGTEGEEQPLIAETITRCSFTPSWLSKKPRTPCSIEERIIV